MQEKKRRGVLILTNKDTGFNAKVPFYEGVNLVGRNPKKTPVAIQDRSISEYHAVIKCEGGIIKVSNSKSKNGVFLNDPTNIIEEGVEKEINPAVDTLYFAQIKGVIEMDPEQKQTQADSEPKKFSKSFKPTEPKELQIQKREEATQRQHSKGDNKKDVKKIKATSITEVSKQISNNAKKNKDVKEKKQGKKQQKQEKARLLDFSDFQETKNEQKVVNEQSNKNKNSEKVEVQKEKIDSKQQQRQSKQRNIKQIKQVAQKSKKESQKVKNKKSLPKKDNVFDEKQSQNIKKGKQKQNRKSKPKQEQKKQEKKQSKLTRQKKGDSVQTKQRKRQKKKDLSLQKVQDEKQPRKTQQHRKKAPQPLEQPFISHPKRQFIHKKVLLSGCVLSFTPIFKIQIVENWRDSFDILVMEQYLRTFKLLYAICLGIPIVTLSWLLESQFRRGIASIDRFMLQIPNHKDLLARSIAKVKEGTKVFADIRFYLLECGEGFHLPIEQIQALIEVAGGTLVKKIDKKTESVRDVIFITKLNPDNEDIKQIKRIPEATQIYTVQLIMQSCLNQSIDWQNNKFVIPSSKK